MPDARPGPGRDPLGGAPAAASPPANVALDCGWGRLLFGQTFGNPQDFADAMRAEEDGQRDIAFYVSDPHVLLAMAPQELFLDPSHTYRLDLAPDREDGGRETRGFTVREMVPRADAGDVNRIYAARRMVPVAPEFFERSAGDPAVVHLVAEDERTGGVVGAVMGVDHGRAFGDPERGSSLWCLAVDPQASQPGIGEALVRRLAERFKENGAAHMDLSVLHDNEQAIALYEKLGFRRVPFFAVKRKNPINEKLFTAPADDHGLNPYARLITDEARRRGIMVDVLDAEGGFFRLTHGGRTVRCRESLSELTSAVAMSICDDKAVTRRTVERAGVAVPEQIEAEAGPAELEAFLRRHGKVVVKPAKGEQGKGVAVGLATMDAVAAAIETARTVSDRVIVEQHVAGEDLRLVVIDYKLVAAAIRRPPRVVGDGRSTIRALIDRQSRRRAAATGGESRIPVDGETTRCLAEQDLDLDQVLPEGAEITVRKAANLHAGGTIHDVTCEVHPRLADAAIRAARAIEIPVVGIDFVVAAPSRPDYAFIEANERPGLANHEPQPTAERFVDLLFPQSVPAVARSAAGREADCA
jgi:GNAT-family acetyltransferase (TIGR03103 family)